MKFKKSEVFTKLLPNFSNLSDTLKGSVLRNIWFNPIDYYGIFSLEEPAYGQDNTSHVQAIVNQQGDIKLTHIKVFICEPINNHIHIRGGSDTFANVLMVAQHEMLHIYLEHFESEVRFFKKYPQFAGSKSSKSKKLISYLQHIQLTRVHQLMDTGIGNYFMKLPDELNKVILHNILDDKWEDMFLSVWEIEPEYWGTGDEPEKDDDTVLSEVGDTEFDSTNGITPNMSKPTIESTEECTTSIQEIARELPNINAARLNNYLLKKLDSIVRKTINGRQTYWDISTDIENKPIGMIEEYCKEPKGILLLDVSGSMAHSDLTNHTRYEIACSLINRLAGTYRVILFNTDIVKDSPRVNMDDLKSIKPMGGTDFSCIERWITKKTVVITDADATDLSILQKCEIVVVINNPKANLKGSKIYHIEI